METEPEKSSFPAVDTSAMKFVSVFFNTLFYFSLQNIFAAFLKKLNA